MDQIAFMAAEKIRIVQQFFKPVERHVASVKLDPAMNPQLPLANFGIFDLIYFQLGFPFQRAD